MAQLVEKLKKLRIPIIFRPFLFLLVAVGLFSALSPYFFTIQNFKALATSSAILMILSVGGALVILTGMVDLGLESVLAATTVVVTVLNIVYALPAWISITAALAMGIFVGLINGLLVTKLKIPSFIATLGMYWGMRGVALVISKGYPIASTSVKPPRPITFDWLAGKINGIPTMFIIALIVIIIAQIFVSNFKKGTEIYAIGGNEAAARTTGINVDSTKILVFIISGFLAALAGVLVAAWLRTGYAWTAQGFSLKAIAAIVLGGVPFVGGYGTLIGAGIGAIIIAMISDILVLLGVSPTYDYIAIAAVLIIAGLQTRRETGLVK